MTRMTFGAGTILAVCLGAGSMFVTPLGAADPAKSAGPRTSQTVTLTIVFDRNSLQGGLEQISEQIGVPIEIVKADFIVNGISGCQSFRLDEKNQTIDSILKKMLSRANPDGKLVYTVRKNPEGIVAVYICTRAEAEKRGEELFPEFDVK